MQPFPNTNSPLINKITGMVLNPWIQYFQQFTQAPPRILTINPGASPFAYQAKEPGYVNVTGGTISALSLTRGSTSIDVTGIKLVPVSIGDIIIVTYSVLPSFKFIPIYGASTG